MFRMAENDRVNDRISGVECIRVKRRRDEDSVKALLLEEERNAKKGKFVFKLSKTVELDSRSDDSKSPLLKLSGTRSDKKMVYVLERGQERDQEGDSGSNQQADQQELPESIAEMLNDYLKIKPSPSSQQPAKKRKASRKHSVTSSSITEPTLPTSDYVYDVYVKESIPEDEDEFVFDGSTIGYIRIVEHSGDLIPEEDEDPEKTMLTDDEDSNEEDYYQNDYPEDEDDDRSIVIGSDEDFSNSEDVVYLDQVDVDGYQDGVPDDEQQDDEFESLFQTYGNSSNLLSSLNAHNYVDLDYDDDDVDDNVPDGYDYDGDYTNGTANHGTTNHNHVTNQSRDTDDSDLEQRHIFFPSDEHDETAIHRDRIFNKLQNMIDKS